MKIKKMITDGSMAPKVTGVGEFINPITSEKIEWEVTCSIGKEQLKDLSAINYDIEKLNSLIEKALQTEFKTSTAQKRYDIISDYAKEHKFDIRISTNPEYTFSEDIRNIVELSERVVVVLDPYIASRIKEFIDKQECVDVPSDTENKTFACAIQLMRTITLFGKHVKIFVYNYAPWSSNNCLVYDEDNPKNCKFITYTYTL